jgi:hypothetical protein
MNVPQLTLKTDENLGKLSLSLSLSLVSERNVRNKISRQRRIKNFNPAPSRAHSQPNVREGSY